MAMDLILLFLALAAFVGLHFLMSHPWRTALVRSFGLKGFLALYSIVAIVTFVWVIVAFSRTDPGDALWNGDALVPWIIASLLTLISAALFLASLFRNPALPGVNVNGLSTAYPRGVYTVTRHPMMFSFAIWGLSHIIIAPTGRTTLLTGGIILLAIGGAHLQDRKKIQLTGREWRTWVKRTNFWPDPRRLGELGWIWLGAVPLWLLLTWLHMPLALIPAGPWRWLRALF